MRKKQIKESLTLIIEGFFKLLIDHDYASITMSDIAIQAQVSRMTLYRYFKNKDEISKYYIKEIIHQFEETINQQTSPNFLLILYTRNKMIYENPKLRMAFNHDIVEQLFKEVIIQSQSLINQYIPNIDQVSKYKKLFVMGGITNITRDWVERGLKETPEEITRECFLVLQQLKE